MAAYAIGHISVKDHQLWAQYREQVPATLAPWNGEIVARGRIGRVLAGTHRHDTVVILRFADTAALQGWHDSPAYQALIPLREAAADVVLLEVEGE